MSKVILTESQLKRLIENSVRQVLNEEEIDEMNWKGALAGLAMGASTMMGGNPAQAQTTGEPQQSVVQINYRDAKFTQGDFSEWVSRNVKYPQNCYNNHIQGRVIVRFTVDEMGHTTNIRVERTPNEELSQAAMDVVRRSPSWIPAKDRSGRRVKEDFYVPIVFRIQ